MNSEFFALVFMLQNSCWIHLGKISNPQTGKTEKNLAQAKVVIDILEMLKEKTKGNLDAEEEKLLKSVLTDLELNYVSEKEKEQGKTEKSDNQKKED